MRLSLQRWSRGISAAALFLPVLFFVAACAAVDTQGTAASTATSTAQPESVLAERKPDSGSFELLYATDRAPVRATAGALSYGSERARFMSFGSLSVSPHRAPTGEAAVAGNAPLHVEAVTEIGRFPQVPYPVETTSKGARRALTSVTAHEKAKAALQAELARRLAAAKRKEVVVFIHGYNNDFDDAAAATGDICNTLSREFVCVMLTWPAGGSGGVFYGYNIDRESGEFAVADLKKAIRIIGETKGVERLHIIAHSRGTDVLVSALQQLGIEAYVSRSSIGQRYKISNILLFAPDIDLDVAITKMFGIGSDPDAIFGTKAMPYGVLPPFGSLHLTVYSSPSDKALRLSTLLFGSVVRLGQLSTGQPPSKRRSTPVLWDASQIAGLADFIEYDGSAGFLGHGYFRTDPTVKRDMVALIRDRLKTGDPGRPLIEVKRPYWRLSEPSVQGNGGPARGGHAS